MLVEFQYLPGGALMPMRAGEKCEETKSTSIRLHVPGTRKRTLLLSVTLKAILILPPTALNPTADGPLDTHRTPGTCIHLSI
ncbi:hypothetical protein PGTUg99_031575 [Puccinia graminis f. sp. tritici]|uniref:Uncharacterized protein n=1 Tax=Puccinia graminis f. sp. tritici TaxID=56615 RepID=A0A5B0RZ73_PUCGR|nr:hypothetical protein PGTUg99_031575 [Puccinia graminis f. sp. tritici]